MVERGIAGPKVTGSIPVSSFFYYSHLTPFLKPSQRNPTATFLPSFLWPLLVDGIIS